MYTKLWVGGFFIYLLRLNKLKLLKNNVIASWSRLTWVESSASDLFLLGAIESGLVEIEGFYLLFTLWRSSQWEYSKIVISFSLSLRNSVPLLGSQAYFIVIPLTTFTHENIISTESWKHKIRKSPAYMHLSCLGVNNSKTFCPQTPLLTVLTIEKNLVHLYSRVLSTYLITLYIQLTTLCIYSHIFYSNILIYINIYI